MAPFLAINDALAFHNTVGAQRKEERLRYLTHYWVNQVKRLPGIEFLTNFDSAEMSCGLATFRLRRVDSNTFEDYLKRKHAILVQSMCKRSWAPEIHGIRITPNLYTMPQELDTFCTVVEKVANKGLPSAN